MRKPQTREQWQKRRTVKIAKRCEAHLHDAARSELLGLTGQAQCQRNAAAFDSEVCFTLARRIAEGHW